MSESKRADRNTPKCGRHARTTGEPCRNDAGQRTSHVGTGACFLHGGNSPGAAPGNDYAVTTGEYETIHLSALRPDEASLYASLDISPIAQAQASLRLTSLREHRILLRINAAEDASEEGFGVTSYTHHRGWQGSKQGKVDYHDIERQSTLTTVMHLEDALTRVQNLKVKNITQLQYLIEQNPQTTGGLQAIVDAIDRSTAAEALSEHAQEETLQRHDADHGGGT